MRIKPLASCALSIVCLSSLASAKGDDEGETPEDKPAETDPANASVLIEPLLAIFGFYEGEVNITVDDTIAASVWGQYFDYTLVDTGLSGFGIGLGAPIFFTGQVYRGAYVYPLVKFQQVDFKVADTDAVSVTYYGPQVTAGYQWTWGRPVGFSLRVGGGLEYSLGELQSDVVDESLSFEGFDYELDAAIGLSF